MSAEHITLTKAVEILEIYPRRLRELIEKANVEPLELNPQCKILTVEQVHQLADVMIQECKERIDWDVDEINRLHALLNRESF